MDRFVDANAFSAGETPAQMRANLYVPSCRTPGDDAPAFSPAYWRDQDVSYISHLAQQNYPARAAAKVRQERGGGVLGEDLLFPSSASASTGTGTGSTSSAVAKNARSRRRRSFFWGLWELIWPSVPSLPSDKYASFHTIPHYTPHSFLDTVLAFFHLGDFRNRQGNLTAADLKRVSTEELLALMQVALSAGERERSSFIARELSSRRVAVDFSARRSSGAGSGSVADDSQPTPPQGAAPSWQTEWYRGSGGGAPVPNAFATTQTSAFFTSPHTSLFPNGRGFNEEGRTGALSPPAASQSPGWGARVATQLPGSFGGLNTSRDFFAPPSLNRSYEVNEEDRSVNRSRQANWGRGPEDADELAEPHLRGSGEGHSPHDRSRAAAESTQIFGPSTERWGRPSNSYATPAWGGAAAQQR